MGGHLIKCLENQKLTPFPEDLSAATVSLVTLSKVKLFNNFFDSV